MLLFSSHFKVSHLKFSNWSRHSGKHRARPAVTMTGIHNPHSEQMNYVVLEISAILQEALYSVHTPHYCYLCVSKEFALWLTDRSG